MDTEKGINGQRIAVTAPERYSVFTRTEKWCSCRWLLMRLMF